MHKNHIQGIKAFTQNKVCELCGESDIRLLENHHIFGKNFSPKIMLLCKNCHYKITHEQNKIAPKRRSQKASEKEKLAFTFLSIGVLIEEIGRTIKETGNILFEQDINGDE